jgi:hypothetical protein
MDWGENTRPGGGARRTTSLSACLSRTVRITRIGVSLGTEARSSLPAMTVRRFSAPWCVAEQLVQLRLEPWIGRDEIRRTPRQVGEKLVHEITAKRNRDRRCPRLTRNALDFGRVVLRGHDEIDLAELCAIFGDVDRVELDWNGVESVVAVQLDAERTELIGVAFHARASQSERLEAAPKARRQLQRRDVAIRALEKHVGRPSRELRQSRAHPSGSVRDIHTGSWAELYQALDNEFLIRGQRSPLIDAEFCGDLARARQTIAGLEPAEVKAIQNAAAQPRDDLFFASSSQLHLGLCGCAPATVVPRAHVADA